MNKIRYSIFALLCLLVLQLKVAFGQDDGCPQSITFQQNHTFSSEISAENTIESSQSTVNPNVNVVFKAGDLITLSDGFIAKENSNFRAFNGTVNCNNMSFTGGNGSCQEVNIEEIEKNGFGTHILKFNPVTAQNDPIPYVIIKETDPNFTPIIIEVTWQSVVFHSVPHNDSEGPINKEDFIVYVDTGCTPPGQGTIPGACANAVETFSLGATQGGEEWRTLESNIPITPENSYQLTVEAQLTNGGIAEVGVKSNDPATNWFKTFATIDNNTNFNPIIIDFDAMSTLNQMDLYIRKVSPGSSLEVRKVCLVNLEEGSDPGPISDNESNSFLSDYPTPDESACGMYVGAATPLNFTFGADNDKQRYMDTLGTNFNITVHENGLKMEYVKGSKCRPGDSNCSVDNSCAFNINCGHNYSAADEGLDILLDSYPQMKVRGHTLCWHGGDDGVGGSNNPDYLLQFVNNTSAVESALNCSGFQGENGCLAQELQRYITKTITDLNNTYPGHFESWDVVNEAIQGKIVEGFREFENSSSNSGSEFTFNNGIPCIWEKIGYESNLTANGFDIPLYIRLAFEAAASVTPPDQALIYNDWGAEIVDRELGDNDPRNRFKMDTQFEMVKALKGAGVRIDGVGFQCHFKLDEINNNSINEFRQNINRYLNDPVINPASGSEFKIYFTEVDIRIPNVKPDGSPNLVTEEKLNAMADQYKMLMDLALEFPGNVVGFITWGITDKYSWVPALGAHPKALLYDDSYNRKNTYDKVLESLNTGNCSNGSNRINNDFSSYEESIFTAYPNPFDQTLKIDFEEDNGKMSIYDMAGRAILTQNIDGSQTSVNTKNLKAGYYLIEVKSNDKIERQKIIKH